MRPRLRRLRNVPRQVIVWLVCVAMAGAITGTLLAWFIPADESTTEESE